MDAADHNIDDSNASKAVSSAARGLGGGNGATNGGGSEHLPYGDNTAAPPSPAQGAAAKDPVIETPPRNGAVSVGPQGGGELQENTLTPSAPATDAPAETTPLLSSGVSSMSIASPPDNDPASAPSGRPGLVAPSDALPPRPSSARNVLRKAGRPLRSVGRQAGKPLRSVGRRLRFSSKDTGADNGRSNQGNVHTSRRRNHRHRPATAKSMGTSNRNNYQTIDEYLADDGDYDEEVLENGIEVDLRDHYNIEQGDGSPDRSSSNGSNNNSNRRLFPNNGPNRRSRRSLRAEDPERCLSSSSAWESEDNDAVLTGNPGDAVDLSVVSKLETALRCIVCLCGAYLCGAYWHDPTPVHYITKALEYTAVAWFTCCAILLLLNSAVCRKQQHRRRRGSSRRNRKFSREVDAFAEEDQSQERQPLLADVPNRDVLYHGAGIDRVPSADLEAAIQSNGVDDNNEAAVEVEVEEAEDEADEDDDDEDFEIERGRRAPLSSELDSLFIIDAASRQRIEPNNVSQPFKIETDYFTGFMLVYIRTPGVDKPVSPSPSSSDFVARSYLRNKLRRFEFQFQVKLKRLPDPNGRVYFGVELVDGIKLGMIQRAFVGAAMAFIKTTNPNFAYSITADGNGTSKSSDRPHMAFPIEEGMNIVVATKKGEEPPKLGEEIFEDPALIKARKNGAVVDWNLEDVYTLALWSAYVDFLDWRCVNLPGIRPFSLTNILQRQHMILTLYEVLPGEAKERRDILEMELSNASKSGRGPLAVQWSLQNETQDESPLPQICTGSSYDEEVPMQTNDDYDAFLEEEQIAQLGEGLYVKSGDYITLRESSSRDEQHGSASGFVTYAGGFAVLQEQSPATIIVEKVHSRSARSKKSLSRRSKLIKSGDTVTFKLVGSGDESETYLSVHRGWYLKWMNKPMNKNGFFTVYFPAETESAYLAVGGTFFIKHFRWSKYMVGVSPQTSTTYAGRMLGLFSPSRKTTDEDDFFQPDADDADNFEGDEKSRSEWLLPLQLRANDASADAMPLSKTSSDEARLDDVGTNLVFSKGELKMDVPAWLEMMNRKDRIPQLAYVVRVSRHDEGFGSDEGSESFIRLRSGRQLSHIMRAGFSWRSSNPRTANEAANESVGVSPSSKKGMLSSDTGIGPFAPSLNNAEDDNSSQQWKDVDSVASAEWSQSSASQILIDNIDEESLNDTRSATTAKGTKRSRKFIGKLAQSVKSRTATTGKKVVKGTVRQSAKVGKGTARIGAKAGKGTVNVTKSIISAGTNKPPSKEPRVATAPRRTRKKIEKDLHAAVSRSMLRMDIGEYQSSSTTLPAFLAGELSAPEQSCRTVSNMLLTMSSLDESSVDSTMFSKLLAAEVNQATDQDNSFLTGGAIQLGVVIPTDDASRGMLVHDCVIARCLWESHWREEWCGLYEQTLSFFAPLTETPCLELALADIQCVRDLKSEGGTNPLPGCPMLAIETSWMCHYVVFPDLENRKSFREKVEAATARLAKQLDPENSLWQAHFWQGFETSLSSSVSSGKGKWADVVSGNKMKPRLVLNNRRMMFDLLPRPDHTAEFVERLLETSLSFSHLKNLKEHPEDLVKFLDATSQLRSLSLDSLDLASPSSFCIFVNIYHCLLQHALLLTVNGPLNKRSFGHFMRTTCYEVGGDVFSLAELQCCVIRGRLSRPLLKKPPAVDVQKKSDTYRFYALDYATPIVNFLLNTADTYCPREVPVLVPSQLEAQVNVQTQEYLRRNVIVDRSKRLILLPRICEAYRNDFAPDAVGAANMCLRYCLSYLDDDTADAIRSLLDDAKSPAISIKYRAATDQYHTTLKLRDYAIPTEFETPIEI